MNSHQQQALWAHALRELADTINAGQAPAPSSLQIWSQYVTPRQLLAIADTTTPEPLQIRDHGRYVAVSVPVGRMLDLEITWVSQVDVNALATLEEQADFRKAIREHNTYCMGAPAGPDDEPAQHGQMDDVAPTEHATAASE